MNHLKYLKFKTYFLELLLYSEHIILYPPDIINNILEKIVAINKVKFWLNLSNLVLVGFMASGKTTVGKLLAKVKKYKFLDIDQEISIQQKKSIPEIFEQYGEIYFRKLETEKIHNLVNLKNYIISTGGGAFCYQKNISALKQVGLTIYLKASFSILQERLNPEQIAQRPLLKDKNKTIELLQQREPFYTQADITIETENLSAEGIVEKIIKLI